MGKIENLDQILYLNRLGKSAIGILCVFFFHKVIFTKSYYSMPQYKTFMAPQTDKYTNLLLDVIE